MTHDQIAIMTLFRLGNRLVARTVVEIADILGTADDRHLWIGRVGNLVKLGYLRTVKSDRDSKTRIATLTPKGEAWMSLHPKKRGRVLTATPMEAAQ